MPDEPENTPAGQDVPHHQQTEDYGGGHIQARHGRINAWLLVVYLVLFVWALYYGYTYWGGLGPGLDLTR
ncbi:hypothetical protein [Cupriavidus oxalaticus]|jgi:hypothetical protein|uniref:Uncharacterized protein n=1 Tax=Cupriavidus oxalaticus TaxID=96344 RepID=A0A375FWI5_9BURK|nr:hypothetical protein [Cupriavidus oxalaticus]QEZ46838.1 hypothetical protein D2917_21825 [Cupriavidus oxalaticus]QRQ88856.1 hypothetical protein JTE91_20195 [Cupriavidus oxalaticus]QRQ92818.1 hypothetical protein JTE92_22065 [Cupriavidus oxalaticus]WQD81424.1 hypothetical protein U0036_09795 [Cupriavidus oxalaticus]SPC12733.1 conserved hypothetical protein [Cupriavidus oxalaticus]